MIIDGITDVTGTGLKDGLIEAADMNVAETLAIVQTQFSTNSTPDTTAAIISADSSKPQITEGKELYSFSYTPRSATNKLLINFGALVAGTTTGHSHTIAIFKNSDVDAIAAAWRHNENGNTYSDSLRGYNEIIAGTTSPITFSMRFGSSGATMYINSDNGTTDRTLGGLNPAYVRIMEIAQ